MRPEERQRGNAARLAKMGRLFGLEAYGPAEIADRVEQQGVQKARLPIAATFMLGMIGGGFIALGAMSHTVVVSDPGLSPGAARLAGGVFFAMGYLIAISAGGEVFTSNNLVMMSWAARRISTRRLLRNWSVVLLANAVGAIGLAVLVMLAGQPDTHGGNTGSYIVALGADKADEPFRIAFFKGVGGNLLICMGVWIAMGARTLTDKFVGPLLPIAALPIVNFEHSVGNLFYLPMALMLQATGVEADNGAIVSYLGSIRNFLAVAAGNIVGGSIMVALVYHVIYRRLDK